MRTKRIMERVKKMCKCALLVLSVNFVANSAVFQVVKEQVMGKAHDFDDVEEYQRETAFTDLYGDFEDLVQARRDQIPTNSATILRVARAQSITDYTDTASRAVTKYTIAPGKNVK